MKAQQRNIKHTQFDAWDSRSRWPDTRGDGSKIFWDFTVLSPVSGHSKCSGRFLSPDPPGGTHDPVPVQSK